MCAEEVAAVRLDVLRDLVHKRGEVGVRIEGDKVWKGAHFREALEREARRCLWVECAKGDPQRFLGARTKYELKFIPKSVIVRTDRLDLKVRHLHITELVLVSYSNFALYDRVRYTLRERSNARW